MSWIARCDFAWIGVSNDGELALFYINQTPVSSVVKTYYDEESYSAVTDYIIYELARITEAKECLDQSVLPDIEKGFFVYVASEKIGRYRRVGVPVKALRKEALSAFHKSLVPIDISSYSDHLFLTYKNIAAIKLN